MPMATTIDLDTTREQGSGLNSPPQIFERIWVFRESFNSRVKKIYQKKYTQTSVLINDTDEYSVSIQDLKSRLKKLDQVINKTDSTIVKYQRLINLEQNLSTETKELVDHGLKLIAEDDKHDGENS